MMKKISLLLFMMFNIGLLQAQTWVAFDEPNISHSDFYCFGTNGNTQFVGSYSGMIYHSTTNEGDWEAEQVGTSSNTFNDVAFASENVGWAVGSGQFQYTTDGGQTWTTQEKPNFEEYFAIYPVSETEAYIAGKDGSICRTTDGGANWELMDISDEYANFYDLNMINGKLWASGWGGALFVLEGEEWVDKSQSNTFSIGNLQATNDGTMWAGIAYFNYPGGYNNRMAFSEDDGDTWEELFTLDAFSNTKFVDFLIIDDVFYALGDHGLFMTSTDNGQTWSNANLPIPSGTYAWMNRMKYDGQYIWVAGNDGILFRTADLGANWEAISYPLTSPQAVEFVNDTHGWILARESSLRTTDGGVQWERISMRGERFYFMDENTGWIVNDIGHVSKTTDGGLSQIPLDTLDTTVAFDMMDIQFVNETTGFILTSDGFYEDSSVFKTTDGGLSWTVTQFETIVLEAMDFLNENHGWLVGEGGFSGDPSIIFETTDGGNTWNNISSSVTTPFYDVDLVSEDNAWLSGYAMHHTTDGGQNFTSYNPDFGFVRAIYAIDENTAYAGMSNNMYHTSDGGLTWTAQPIMADISSVDDLVYVNYNLGIAIDEEQAIIQFDNGEEPISIEENNSFANISLYPNPASTNTTVLIELAKAADIEVSIFNAIGQQIQSIDKGQYSAGQQIMNLDLDNYTNGLYFCQIRVDGELISSLKFMVHK